MLGVEKGGPQPDQPPRRRRWDVLNNCFDGLVLLAAVVLVALGALNLYAISGWQSAVRQLAVVAPGLVLLVALRRVRIERLAGIGWGCYGLSVALLAAVPFVGVANKGAQRWIGAGAFSVQPSELAKLGLLLVLAHVLTSERPPGRRFAWALGLWAVPTGLTLLQPDLSTATLLTALLVAMLILARIPWRYLLPPIVAAVVAAPLALPLLRDYQLERLQGFFTGSSDAAGGYTLQQARIALASGGLTGRFGEGAHRLMAQYLPENHTDLAFASIAQQFGLVAAIVAVAVEVWHQSALVAAKGGGDFYWARHLPSCMTAAGLIDITATTEGQFFRGGSPWAELTALSWEQLTPLMVDNGYDPALIAAAIAELTDPDRWFPGCPMVAVSGRHP